MIARAVDSPLMLADLSATEAFGRRLAGQLRARDVVTLEGPLGAGKTALARAVIRTLLGATEADVPSPTFTLVQTYDAPDGLAIWHVDLYRLDGPSDVIELGLDDAFDHGLTLIEWPDRMGSSLPRDRLALHFSPPVDDHRAVIIREHGAWQGRLVL